MWHFTIMCMFGLFIDIKFTLDDWHFTGSNIALHKNANQMPGTYHDTFHHNGDPDTYLYYNANLAVDGNTDTNFLDKSCTSTSGNNYGPASWTVDLRQQYYVKGIRIYKRHNSKGIRLQSFTVIGIGNSGKTTLYNDDDPSHQKHYEDEIIDIPLIPHHAYNSITIQIPARDRGFNGGEGAFLTLCEVQIFGLATCQRPVTVHGSYTDNNNMFVNGQSLSLVCNNGYESTSSNTRRVCQTDHSWSNGHIQCNTKRCNIKPIQNGSYNVTLANIEFPEVVSFECKTGYKIIQGSKTRTCQSNKSLSGQNPVCKEIICSESILSPAKNHYKFDHGFTHTGRIQYNETIHITCKEGHERVTGSGKLTCIDDDIFVKPELTCQAMKCQKPLQVHGFYLDTKTQFVVGESIALVCNNGYEVSSTNTTSICQINHSWSNNHIRCNPKRCIIRPIENGSYNVTSTYIEFQESISSQCIKGFKPINGNKTRTCRADESLSGTDLVCKEVLCSTNNLKPFKNHYEYILEDLSISNRIKYNDSIRTTCKKGYGRFTGSERRTCIDVDIFDESELMCTVIEASNDQQSSPLPIITGLASGCGLSIIVIIILVVVLLRKRRHLPNEQTTTEPYTSLDFTRPGASSTESNYSEISNTNMALHVL